ncbi:uncharacterized protein BDZ99DRAFT_449179 [Mytilinidion resinicola]|uniref:Integral membrane protein n=1 Tax=Mytilinidion resinicola TaxID=574789 RepID=A0A6A6YEK9_9PEZI|nr:uncharacterized protein BDZ99DRAFT_449179 [Mytilinidion resinicola]KAF2806434.1 integral membrane protein [Mytilinidion resinicola]
MGIGAIAEPLVVVTLLFGGTWINRNKNYNMFARNSRSQSPRSRWDSSPDSIESGSSSPQLTDSLLGSSDRPASPSLLAPQDSFWRRREISLLGIRAEVTSPNTRRFKGKFLSRLLQKFPFLVEAWYWALIYWVYQIGRALTALTLVEGTVAVARKHALQLIHIEQRLGLFQELPIQHWFLAHPLLMHWINRIYSFIHIPGTILFLVWLFHYTSRPTLTLPTPATKPVPDDVSTASPALYEARRRTMAVCNLIAFIVFTAWPCMPPRLLSDPNVPGEIGDEARSFGFVDTVHGAEGESSVWTQNKFCNQYAAMPSLHFGYSLLIGLTIATIPLAPHHRRCRTLSYRIGSRSTFRLRLFSRRRLMCLAIGIAYPLTILIAIIATANHFILDAVAGACVCGLAWTGNRMLLNLRPVEDWFLWCVRIHKPEVRRGDAVAWVWEGFHGGKE